MRGRKTWSLAAAVLLLAAVCVVVVVAECPNGCSGNGDCMARDKCDCYKNYQGNDCADRTCLFGRAHIDTPKGDINMDKDVKSAGWILKGSQQDPEETWEYFNPSAIANEAHFYMECSNKGICDRATGLCQCFDGYEGNGCQRTTCPGKCNDHGTCESIRELASKNGGTLFGREGSVGAVNYDLWDANTTYGCRCDPWFFGPDCNKRNCKVGVDPLYKAGGSPRYETFVVHAYADSKANLGVSKSWIRLRVFDYYGESYITKKIPILDETATSPAGAGAANLLANVKAVTDAINGVPNLTFAKVKCDIVEGTDGDLEHFKSARPAAPIAGTSVICQYTHNPGKMRIPEIADHSTFVTASYVVTTSMQGEDEDWFTLKSVYTAKTVLGKAVTLLAKSTTTPSTDPVATPLLGKLIKIGPHIVRVSTTPVANTGVIDDEWEITLEYDLPHPVGSDIPIFTTDPIDVLTVAAATQTGDLAVGSDLITFGPTAPDLATGDLLFIENAFYNVQEITDDGLSTVANNYARLDKPFGGDVAGGADVSGATLFKVTLTDDKVPVKSYQYVSECSGRGMCGYETGVCTCFKGYTNDNCDRQNILAL